MYSNVSSPEIIDQPVYQDIEDSVRSSFHEVVSPVKRPVLRSPLPTGRLKQSFSHDDLQTMVYEEPVCDFNATDNYHLLQDNGSTPSSSARSTMERCRSLNEEWYDDVGVNDAVVYTMNKHPPPVWKPDRGTLEIPPPLPPNRRAVSSEPEDVSRRKGALPHPQQVSPSRKPLPPPRPMGSTGDVSGGSSGNLQPGRSDMFGIKDNPVFKRKLEEKRQELYGPTTHGRSLSMGDGEEFTQESYESVLFTVGDTPDPPALPSKTASMRRNVHSPSPPPLPSRELVRPPPITQQSPVSPRQRSPIRPPEPISPTLPPPLPSRELLDPTRPSITALLSMGQKEPEEAPPPVPLRQSSNRQRNISSLPPDQLPDILPPKRPPPQLPVPGVGHGEGHNQLIRRNSLPSSPTPSDVSDLDRREPIPVPSAANRGRLEPPPFSQACRSVPNVQPRVRPQPKPKTFRPSPLTRQEVVDELYDDTVPAQESINPHPSSNHHRLPAGGGLGAQENTPQNRVAPPPRVSPRDLQKERSPKKTPPVPSSKPAARDPLPPPPPSHSPAAQRGPKPKPPAKPAVPSTKPAIPSAKPTVPARKLVAEKPPLAEKPSLAEKPVIAEKPAPPRKPVVATRNPAMINLSASSPAIAPRKSIAPPTAPKRYRPSTDGVPSQDSSPPFLQPAPASLANKHKPKPLLPKKPVASLCS